MDTLTPRERSKRMSLIRSSNTKPELRIAKALEKKGYKFQLHRRGLPGTPDFAFLSRRKIVFMHGCFWHGHHCQLGRMPKTRRGYWLAKIEGNRLRDRRVRRALRKLGWDVLVLWECQSRNLERALARVNKFLTTTGNPTKRRSRLKK